MLVGWVVAIVDHRREFSLEFIPHVFFFFYEGGGGASGMYPFCEVDGAHVLRRATGCNARTKEFFRVLKWRSNRFACGASLGA